MQRLRQYSTKQMKIPSLGMKCSHVGNITFPALGINRHFYGSCFEHLMQNLTDFIVFLQRFLKNAPSLTSGS